MDHLDVAPLTLVFRFVVAVGCRLPSRCQEGLDVADDAGQQTQETKVFAEAASGVLFGMGGLVQGESDRERGLGLVQVGDVLDERVLGAGVDEAERG